MDRRAKPKKGKAEAKRPRARTSPKVPSGTVRDLEERLAEALKLKTEALETQTATSDILRVISSSPTSLKPVLDAVAESSARLCDSHDAQIMLLEGQKLERVAAYGPMVAAFTGYSPTRLSVSARAVIDRDVVHVHDLAAEVDTEYPRAKVAQVAQGTRSCLAVPLIREGIAIGVILIRRLEVRPFSDRQISLLQTFADQAVIAIENVRLFKELEARNADLTESLEQQTATAEILRLIGTSPTDAQPVFDGIARSGVRVFGALGCAVFVVEGDTARVAATHGIRHERIERFRTEFPSPLSDRSDFVRTVQEGIFHLADIEHNPEATADWIEQARLGGYRTRLMAPMMRGDSVLGIIAVTHTAPAPFPNRQVQLLKTFADQAVIAIENVRLFKELEASNRELTEALDTQTATSEILRVIAGSPTDVQRVFDTIADHAWRLCDAGVSGVLLFDGQLVHVAALGNIGFDSPIVRQFPMPPSNRSAPARAVLTRRMVHIPDVLEDPEYPVGPQAAASGFRSALAMPMLREGQVVGSIVVGRSRPGPYSTAHMELLKTFADQAVIAIENVRLFKELEARTEDLTRSVSELRALGEIGQAISSTLDVQTVLRTIVARATELSGTDAGVIYEYDAQGEIFLPRATEQLEAEIVETMLATPVRKGEGATGRLAEVQESFQVPDIVASPAESRVRDALVRAGYRALLAVPLVREGYLIGGLTVIRKTTGEFEADTVELLTTFATQSALAIQNARLFREIEQKSRELEAASRHKSEFLANMSHELRTPLNVIIGYSEMLQEEAQDRHQEAFIPDLEKINTAAKHQLSLINDILDLSKVEAGRMELEPSDFDLPSAIDNALTLVRERATRLGITLGRAIDDRVGVIRADERKVKQVLLNLLSNALKFTPEGGRIDVGAGTNGDMAEISVADTGVGIAPEDHEAVFEEFRQVGTADRKVEGTGLGLALCRRFVELHGGRISVKSQLGQGSTFTFTLPVRREG